MSKNRKILKGLVIKSTGSWYLVKTTDNKQINCKIKGRFRLDGIKTTNPVAVGDHVEVEIIERQEVGVIRKIYPRVNHIIRKSTKLSKVSHIIAANIDLALLVATIKYPKITTGFIDRFLVTAEAYHIPAAIVFNKTDIYHEKDNLKLDELSKIYQNADYKTFRVSALTGNNVNNLIREITNKVCLFSGVSGVGKSALVNAIEPGLTLKTGNISNYHKKGRHTTTFPEMHTLSFGGYIIDTPGIKEFGLVEFRKEEIAERFPEFRRYQHNCKFNNCTHIHEPGCAVKKAINEGTIARSRYESYLRIYNDDYLDKELWEWE